MGCTVLYSQIPNLNRDIREQGNQLGLSDPADSLRNDSLLADIEIPPDVRLIDREALFKHKSYRIPLVRDFAITHYWDELDLAPGFLYSLGQIGKPYQLYQYGLNDRYDPEKSYWRDPIFERYNIYIQQNESEVPFMDTRTPYVNAKYAQASKQMQRIDATVSRNINAFWNVSLGYKGRQAQGAYLNFNTNHTALFLSTRFRSRNSRYHLFGSGSYDELDDDLNGGEVRTVSSFATADEGEILRDNAESLNDLFRKNEANLIANDANRKRFLRQAQIDQYYHLIRDTDSTTHPHRLTLRAQLSGEWANYTFKDIAINVAKLDQHAIPVYPNRDTSTTEIFEFFKSRRYKALGAVSYSLKGPVSLHTDGYVAFEQINLDQDSLNQVSLDRFEIFGTGTLGFKWGDATFSIHQRATNLYNPQNRIGFEVNFYPLKHQYTPEADTLSSDSAAVDPSPTVVTDTAFLDELNSPLVMSMKYKRWGQNPSLFQTHYLPSPGNVYEPLSGAENQQFNQWQGRIQWQRLAGIRNGDTLLPTYYFAEVFATRIDQMIYYDREMNVRQASTGTPLSWFGAKIGLRTRLIGKTYLESELTWQEGTTDATDDFQYYAENIPSLWGKASLYYDNRDLSFAGILRIGVDVFYFTDYRGFTLDMPSGEFFPTNYEVGGYLRTDIYFATKVKVANIFFKFSHINEGLIQRGYYTTPFYPMLERTFSLGIDWSFFN